MVRDVRDQTLLTEPSQIPQDYLASDLGRHYCEPGYLYSDLSENK